MTAWMTMEDALLSLYQREPHLADKYFDTPGSYVVSGSRTAGRPPGFATTPVWSFASFAGYARSTPYTTYALYVPETWAQTPVLEKQHPKAYIDAFCTVAAARHQNVIASPARGLLGTAVPEPRDCPQLTGEDLNGAFLRCRIPEACACADVLNVQSQVLQRTPEQFAELIHGARSQRPAPAELWAGLSVMRGDPIPLVAECYNAVKGVVDGFWLNASAATVAEMISFLEHIERTDAK